MKINKLYSRLVLAVLLLIIEIGLIIFGMFVLSKYISRIYVLNQSIINISNEIENSLNTKRLITRNSGSLKELEKNTIRKEEDLNFIAETIEEYAGDLGLFINIDNIELTDGTALKPKALSQDDINKSKAEAEKKPVDVKDGQIKKEAVVKSKPVYITITSRGDFEKLVALLKMLENSEYVIQVSQYSIKQVVLYPSNSQKGVLDVKEIGSDPLGLNEKLTWLLKTKLIIYTHIQ